MTVVEHERSTGAGETPAPITPDLQHAVEQFLYLEGELLDERRNREWLDLVAEDCVYQVGTRPSLDSCDDSDGALSLAFDDDKGSLTSRVKRLESGMAWAEEPPSRTRYLITNVRVTRTGPEFVVRSNFLRYRSRLETMVHVMVGSRADTLRPVDTAAGFLIARRLVTLDQNVILSNNLSMFF